MKYKFPKKSLMFLTATTAGAAAHGFVSGTPGHRKDYAKEGAITGAALGGLVIASPKAAKIVWRKIKGRIIPIKVKA